jgi:hypothetical protein
MIINRMQNEASSCHLLTSHTLFSISLSTCTHRCAFKVLRNCRAWSRNSYHDNQALENCTLLIRGATRRGAEPRWSSIKCKMKLRLAISYCHTHFKHFNVHVQTQIWTTERDLTTPAIEQLKFLIFFPSRFGALRTPNQWSLNCSQSILELLVSCSKPISCTIHSQGAITNYNVDTRSTALRIVKGVPRRHLWRRDKTLHQWWRDDWKSLREELRLWATGSTLLLRKVSFCSG